MPSPETEHPAYQADPAFSFSCAELRVHDLERQIRFYHDVLGLYVHVLSAGSVGLSDTLDANPMIVLSPGAARIDESEVAPRLCHLGLRCPSKTVLATCVARMIRHGLPVDGTADLGVSEAVYFRDPEGNQIELYVDRPEDQWRNAAGDIIMKGLPLDVNDLLQNELLTSEPVTEGIRVGHVHLYVTDLEASESFYQDVLGLKLTFRTDDNVRFLAGGDYHHHIAINDWLAPRSSPEPDGVAGLSRLRVALPPASCLGLHEHAAKQGIRLIGSSEFFTLTDPDGFLIDVGEI